MHRDVSLHQRRKRITVWILHAVSVLFRRAGCVCVHVEMARCCGVHSQRRDVEMVTAFDWIDTERFVCRSSGNGLEIMKRQCPFYNDCTCWNPIGHLFVSSVVHQYWKLMYDCYGAVMMLVEEE